MPKLDAYSLEIWGGVRYLILILRDLKAYSFNSFFSAEWSVFLKPGLSATYQPTEYLESRAANETFRFLRYLQALDETKSSDGHLLRWILDPDKEQSESSRVLESSAAVITWQLDLFGVWLLIPSLSSWFVGCIGWSFDSAVTNLTQSYTVWRCAAF